MSAYLTRHVVDDAFLLGKRQLDFLDIDEWGGCDHFNLILLHILLIALQKSCLAGVVQATQ